MNGLFLGLDSSTQSLTAVVIDLGIREVVHELSIPFDETLPAYGTDNGVFPGSDPTAVHAPPLMWAEALDVLFERMSQTDGMLSQILAISGSGQQHGSVYLNGKAEKVLKGLDPSMPLTENLEEILSRQTSPIWMDSSTTEECREICEALGGLEATTEATGSTTFERFTGPQIRRFFKTDPHAYEDTDHIWLVSSFMASLLAGRIAPIDHGDGSGMNLMDIRAREWHPEALRATAPDLDRRLPPLAEPWACIGPVSRYFAERYGLNENAKTWVWSGDNPNSVIGLGLIREGMVAISLGTSDTYFGTMKDCRTDPRGEGHVFVSPTGDYMTLICFKNGSLAREKIKDAFGLDWDGFSRALSSAPPGNEGKVMLPYFEPEIVPNVLEPGVRRFGLEEDDIPGNCRAVVEAQMISMRIHAQWMGVRPEEIYATGGASTNRALLQVMADVQGCPVHRFETTNSAALGAALRAAHGYLLQSGREMPWDEVVSEFAVPVSGSIVRPAPETRASYAELIRKYEVREAEATGKSGG